MKRERERSCEVVAANGMFSCRNEIQWAGPTGKATAREHVRGREPCHPSPPDPSRADERRLERPFVRPDNQMSGPVCRENVSNSRSRRRITQAAYAYYVGFAAAYCLLNVGYRSSQGSHGRVLQKLRDVDPCAQLFSQIAPVPCRNTVPLTCFLPRCLRLAEALEDPSFAVHAEPII